MASGGNDEYFRPDGDFDDAGNTGVESNPDEAYNNSYFQPDEFNHPLRLNGRAVNDGMDNFRSKADSVKDALKGAEKSASKKPNINGKGGDKNASLGEKEKNVDSDKDDDNSQASKFKSAVKGAKQLEQGNYVKAAGNLKKAGPVMAIIVLLGMAAFSSFTGQMAMPFSFMTQIRENFDSISASQSIRSKTFLKFQTGKQKNIKCIKAHYFRADEFKPSKRLTNRLSKQGITFEEDSDGVRVMRYKKNADDPGRIIVADDSQATGDKLSFRQLYDSDPDFRHSYDTGSSIWRTATSAWFDSSMKPFLEKIGIKSRNAFHDYKSNTDDAETKFKETVSGNTDSGDGGEMSGKITSTEIEDENKTTKTSSGTTEETKRVRSSVESSSTISTADVDTKTGDTSALRTKLKTVAGSAVDGSTAIANFYCAASDAVGAITAVVAAYQTLQVIQLASTMLEGIQKAQTDDVTESPIHELSNSLTKKTENTYTEYGGVKEADDSTDAEPTFVEDESTKVEVTRSRSAMEANAVGALYSGEPVDYNDPSVKSFNTNEMTANMWKAFDNPGVLGAITGKISSIASNMSVSATAFRNCTIAKLAAAGVSLLKSAWDTATTIASCIASITNFGASCVASVFKELAEEAVKAALKSIVISVVVSFVISHVTKVLIRTVVTDVAGEDLGNAIVDGANAYMGRNHQYSGGAVANKESLVSYYIERDKVLADEARYERESRSPFDVTSKYTFFGSLATQMIPLASKMTSITSGLEGVGAVINNAFSSLIPSSSAVSAGIRAQADSDRTAKLNPNLYDIGGVGDAFGNPYIITDTKTLGNHPADIVNDVDSFTANVADDDKKNLLDVSEEDGDNVPKIGEESNLAKYIKFCGQRQSPFGMGDQNVANSVDKVGSFGGTVGQGILNGTPVFGDIADIMSNETKLENMGWISGKSCVIGNEVTDTDDKSPGWDETKKYQRFIEDQRLAEAEGIIEKSAVSEFLADYYEKNPIDYSYEGMLARYSGLTKENVIATLDMMDVMNFVANYKPADLYPYPQKNNQEEEIKLENEYDIQTVDMLAMKNIIYDTNRYRNFAA